MKFPGLVLGLVFTAVSTTGCESLGGGLDIVNETGETLYLRDTAIPPDGGRLFFEMSDCTTSDIGVSDEDGNVVAEITEEWCPGQTWTITGRDDSVLEDG